MNVRSKFFAKLQQRDTGDNRNILLKKAQKSNNILLNFIK